MDQTRRFSNRVSDYILYRPQYPIGLIPLLEKKIGLTSQAVVADVGSGTGISSIPFLNNGNVVYAVEPNLEMREAAEEIHQDDSNFKSINGTAEATTLPNASVDLIFSGQAFHWFDLERAKIEWQSILKPDGHIVLCWNQRNDKTPFLSDYEAILKQHISSYRDVQHRNITNEKIQAFLEPRKLKVHVLPNYQKFDLQGLKGRLMSSSYCPVAGKEHDLLMSAMEQLFQKHHQQNKITFDYETYVYIG